MTTLIRTLMLAAGLAMAANAASAAEPAKKPVKTTKAKAKPAKAAKPAAAAPVDEAEPDVADAVKTDYNCELGNKITVYHNEKDDSQISLRWKQRLHRLTRVGTTTGAQRFENAAFGLIWIGIPAKAMLLDSKKGQQLANECKNPEQAKAAAPETK